MVYRQIVILTGSGISAESGIPTFRDAGGIWAQYDYMQVATPEGFERNPALVHEFYNLRRRGLEGISANAGHVALARLEAGYPGAVTIVTQNVDDLHEQAGSNTVIHMHGELNRALCACCQASMPWKLDLSVEIPCPACGAAGGLRPDVVWFGEVPYHMEQISDLLGRADLFISIGTSGNVYPASGFVAYARDRGAWTVELNLEPSEGVSLFDEVVHGPASVVVPSFVDRLLAEAA